MTSRLLATTFEPVPALGARVRVARMGSGPPLLCLHGYPDNLQIFCELLPRLAADFEAIAIDWPGLGQSDPWPRPGKSACCAISASTASS